jgi:hypothetical protein
LALVQVLVLYHLVWARASLNRGGQPSRAEPQMIAGADSALHT